METGKTGKYFKYAIGEIALVVIGILIALSINNWNENQKNSNKAFKTLTTLKSNLAEDTLRLSGHIKYTEKEYQFTSEILKRSRAATTNLDTLIHIARNQYRYPWITPIVYNNAILKSIQTSEIFEILSDSLKEKIIDLDRSQTYYSNALDNFNKDYRSLRNNFSSKYVLDYEKTNKTFVALELSWKNIDQSDFASKFNSILTMRNFLQQQYLKQLKIIKGRTTTTLKLIDKSIQDHD